MTQQGGCFSHLAQQLNAEGYTAVAMDLRGHGKWFHSVDDGEKRRVSYPKSAQDLLALAAELRSSYPGLPIFGVGESVGAGVMTLAAGQKANAFDGIVLVSAGTRPHTYNPIMVTRDFVVGIVDLDKQLDIRKYITHYSSEDPRITKEMITDQLSRTTLTGKEILQTAAFIRKTPRSATKLPEQLPVLILQGQIDKIVATSSVKSILRHIHSANKKLVIIPHCGHILLGTAYLKQPVVKQLTDWLQAETQAHPHTVAALDDSQNQTAGKQ
jgi:alpha-beta hydrolase superfamily lysophospholipase